jgi:hypothetical protein
MRSVVVALAVLAFVGAASGCTFGSETATPKISKTDLQEDVAEIIKESGVEPESVTCAGDLAGEVGQTTQCEVEASPTEYLLAPIVTVTSVEDGRVNWRLDPTLTQSHLERAIAEQSPGAPVESVSCEAGLEGKEGSLTHCHVTADGVTVRRTVRVMSVEGLQINWRLLAVLPRAEIEKSLLDEFARQFGQRPDTARCSGDLQGVEGSTVNCTVVEGPDSRNFLITATSVNGDQIYYEYEPAD